MRHITNLLHVRYLKSYKHFLKRNGWLEVLVTVDYLQYVKGNAKCFLYFIPNTSYVGIELKDLGMFQRFINKVCILGKKHGTYCTIYNHICMGLSNTPCKKRKYFCLKKKVFLSGADVNERKCVHREYKHRIMGRCNNLLKLDDFLALVPKE